MVPSLVGWCDWDKCILWDTGLSMEPGQGGLICFNQKEENALVFTPTSRTLICSHVHN